MDPAELDEDATGIIWCFGEKTKYAHAYPGKAGVESHIPLCGMKCNPTAVLEVWDLSKEEIRNVTCPKCLARMKFAPFMKPLSVLYREKKQ